MKQIFTFYLFISMFQMVFASPAIAISRGPLGTHNALYWNYLHSSDPPALFDKWSDELHGKVKQDDANQSPKYVGSDDDGTKKEDSICVDVVNNEGKIEIHCIKKTNAVNVPSTWKTVVTPSPTVDYE